MKIAVVLAALIAIPAIASADDKKTTPDKTVPEKTTDKTTDKSSAKLADSDVAILAHVHMVNLMEIDMGKLAQRVGTAPVKKYGEMLVQDHTAADKEAMAFAKKRGLAKIPDEKPATEAEMQEHKDMMTKVANLKKMKGADFDKEFISMMISGHDGELGKSDTLISTATDADLKSMLEARKTTLKRHADSARDLQRGNPQASAKP